jgi:hypothetical protein
MKQHAIEMGEIFVSDFKEGFWRGFGHDHVRTVCFNLIDELDKVVLENEKCGKQNENVKRQIDGLRRKIMDIQVYNGETPGW